MSSKKSRTIKNKSKKTNNTVLVKKLMPAFAGIAIALLVLIALNSQILGSIIVRSTYKPANDSQVISEPNSNQDQAGSNIVINKLNISAPIDMSLAQVNEEDFQNSLRSGVVHYPDTAKPGEVGNVVVFGHSSGQLWAPGDYKFVFANLDKLVTDDKIYINYSGKTYEYVVSDSKVVLPTDLSVLDQTTNNTLTLITCYPVGSNAKRLIVTARQINPAPDQSKAADKAPQSNRSVQNLPSSNKTLWETIKSVFSN